eukprot:s9_g23.t1
MQTFQNVWDFIQEQYPATAPRNLGSMGYDGRVSLYISRTVRETAWEHEGLNLEFYRGYNMTWHNAARYFDAPHSLNTSDLKPCDETRLMFSNDMKLYLEMTGDLDGVNVVNETVLGKCFDGYFWFYWWVPDPTFLSLSPIEVVFPAFDQEAFDKGDRRNAVTSEPVEILVSQDVDAWEMSISDVNEMLEHHMQSSADWREVACRWILAHEDTWQKWLPFRTKCLPQFGLYNAIFETFVDNREDPNALTCRACPSGAKFLEIIDVH